jgi:hypothetical protein
VVKRRREESGGYKLIFAGSANAPIVVNVVRTESAGTDHLQKVQLFRRSMQLRKPAAQAPRNDQPPPVKVEPDDAD